MALCLVQKLKRHRLPLIRAASPSKVMNMTQSSKKIDLNDLRDKTAAVKEALDAFLEENKLTLSPQNRERAFQHVLACMNDHKDLSADDVRGYLNEVLEYHEYNIDMMNKTGLAEDSLIKILITADYESIIRPDVPQWKFGWRSLPLPVAVSLVLVIAASFAGPKLFTESPNNQTIITQSQGGPVITRAQEETIKALVHELSAKSGETHIKIYNRIKVLPAITQHGPAPSYKKFNHAQYLEAKIWLERALNSAP